MEGLGEVYLPWNPIDKTFVTPERVWAWPSPALLELGSMGQARKATSNSVRTEMQVGVQMHVDTTLKEECETLLV